MIKITTEDTYVVRKTMDFYQLYGARLDIVQDVEQVRIVLRGYQKARLSENILKELESFETIEFDPDITDRILWFKTLSAWLRYFEIVTGLKRNQVRYEIYLRDGFLAESPAPTSYI